MLGSDYSAKKRELKNNMSLRCFPTELYVNQLICSNLIKGHTQNVWLCFFPEITLKTTQTWQSNLQQVATQYSTWT